MISKGTRTRRIALALGGIAWALDAAPLLAQATQPSSITPQTLRPPSDNRDQRVDIPEAGGLAPPPGADQLRVTIGRLVVEGTIEAVRPAVEAIAAGVAGKSVTLAELYKAASAVEAAHARAGYVLARVVVPPQQIGTGGDFRIVVVSGYFEQIETSGLPARVRRVVERRTRALLRRPGLRLGEIEQRLLTAGEAPGLALTSTLARGREAGGARLLLAGRQDPITASLAVDNSLDYALGGHAITAQLSLNSVLGLGEQIYGFAVGGINLPRNFDAQAPISVYGGGFAIAPGDGRLSLNPEVTFSRTRPAPRPGVPVIVGRLRRLTARASYTLARSRRGALTLNGAVEHIRETTDAVDFATRLSFDSFLVLRAGASYTQRLGQGDLSASLQVSRGVDGLRGDALGAGVLPSRQGATPDFTKAVARLRFSVPFWQCFTASLAVRGQANFGPPLFRSEQMTLEGNDALSAYVGGLTAVDSAVLGRAEIGAAFDLGRWAGRTRLVPYIFGAGGAGFLDRPTAVEQGETRLWNAGAGVRGALRQPSIGVALEYATGAPLPLRTGRANRVSFSVSLGL